ncbi:hypothetical protein [Wolbachia endosymbiont of Folsomia candida]|uniref:hypothetical protein n=1 Tax=Wolbachia endosymbiont of Folsomia candida TaxID=169402 RepID=UPI000A622B8B|nr:hypothetical protein [Wolbachia endosymbiont of Folsomia candida]APR98326.1 hypothetical protein ASM33_03430 [Wolbachia endosymbiont of Folsomia candida]
MFGRLKNAGKNLVLITKGFFRSSEPTTTYVKDLRKVLTYHDGRKCQYPKNYDEVVKSDYQIIQERNDKKELVYKLVYGQKDKNGEQPKFELDLVKQAGGISYFTLEFLANPKAKHYSGFYNPFGFTKIDLEKHLPVFEVQKIDNPKDQSLPPSYRLINSSTPTKKIKEGGKIKEVVDETGRNGQLLYTSDYKKLNTSFSEIRKLNGRVDKAKSLISVPIILAASLAKIAASIITYLPTKLGEYLLSKQNTFAKAFGYLLFTPAAIVKNLVNIGATFLKLPICAFVANEKKYGDQYFTMWKYQLKECLKEAKSDFKVFTDGKREPEQKENRPDLSTIIGTKPELDAMKPGIEKKLEAQKNTTSEKGNDTLRSENRNKSFSSESLIKNQTVNNGSHVGRLQQRPTPPASPRI